MKAITIKGKIVNGNIALKGEDLKEYKKYMKFMEGKNVDVFIDYRGEDGTRPQMSMLYSMMNLLANELGYTTTEIKSEMKRRLGPVLGQKSIAEYDKEQMSLAINEVQRMMDINKIEF